MSAVVIRSQFSDLFGASMLPVLEKLFTMEEQQHPMRREALFRTVTTDRDIYQTSELHDLPLFEETPENTEYSYNRPKQGYDKTFVMSKYTSGFSISQEAVEDGKFDLIADMVRKLARAAKESQEIQAMDILNGGFSTVQTPDGVSLFNTAHALPSGGSFRNKASAAADLSDGSLRTALADFETQFVGDTGIIYNIRPKYLVVHSNEKRTAKELVGSELRVNNVASDNGPTNAMNALREDGLIVVSSPHLSDLDSWFLIGDSSEHGLTIVKRQALATKSEEDFDCDAIKYKASYREKIGASHARGVFGVEGA